MRRPIRHRLGLILILLLLPLGGLAWLAGSDSGLQAALQLATTLSGGRLHGSGAAGRLLGPLDIASLRWDDGELRLDVAQLHLDWSPTALLRGRLLITTLTAARLDIVSQPGGPPPVAPAQLLLPLAVTIERIAIARLDYGNLLGVDDIAGRFASDGRQHRLTAVHAAYGDIVVSGAATLDGRAPLPLTAEAEIASRLGARPLLLALSAAGPLPRLSVRATGRQGVNGRAEVLVTPFAATAFAHAHLQLSDIDPADWQRGAPQARLGLQAELVPAGGGVAGHFALSNAEAGPFDRQRLPLASLHGRLDWQDAGAELADLAADLGGGGRLAGHGRWQDGRLSLDLTAAGVDAARLVSVLHRSRLAGSLQAEVDANRQMLATHLEDERLTLDVEASHSGNQLELHRFALGHGPARLAVTGRLALDGELAFAANGTIERFDPSLFGRLPSAHINASFDGSGTLRPQPRIDTSFRLDDSRLAGQPLRGQGRLRLAWPHIPQADIELVAGANTLQAQGAFGRPGERLTLTLAAPELAAFGVDGSLAGRLELAGSSDQPQLQLDLRSPQLGRAGLGRVRDLALTGSGGRTPDAPLQLTLAVGGVDGPQLTPWLRQVQMQLSGSRQAHHLEAAAELPDARRLEFSAAGGLADGPPRWRGRLLTAQSRGAETARNARLTAPADLVLAADAWSFGPAQLAGDPLDWRADVTASGEKNALRARFTATGSRIGRLAASLDAGLQGAWALDRDAPWQGRFDADIGDLAWLGELIGEGWESGGRLDGHLDLTGSPAQPRASGRVAGERLLLRQPLQGLHLADGELLLEVDAHLLRLRRLTFASLLQPLPRALRSSDDGLVALTSRPGRLEASGELALDPGGGPPRGALDLTLERLGAMQLPEQWLLLSGNGRLDWHAGRLAIGGKLAVDAGYWQLAQTGLPRLGDDVVVRRSGQPVATGWRPQLELDLATDLGRNFLFSGAGLSSRLTGEVRLRASGRDLPRASGSVRLRDGRFDAYGQQLTIERGRLTFDGLLDNPALDVLAVRKGLAVEPGVQIGGTARRPVIHLVSDPELPDAEKLSWLVLGHGPEAVGGGDAGTLLAAASSLLGSDAAPLSGQLKNLFGIDEFSVRQGELGGADNRHYGSRLDAGRVDTTAATGNQILSIGKRLSNNAMLSYEQVLGRAEGIVKLTVDLGRQVALVGRAGSDNALDIFYTVAFGRPAGKRPSPPPPAADEGGSDGQ